ncbi:MULTISPECIES: hypothetical protein [unclassified Variovorax]|uniref:hypothetical protein n=1 Tax=unclassified Variovorax TaxID=663243 RepID=UPI003F5173E9
MNVASLMPNFGSTLNSVPLLEALRELSIEPSEEGSLPDGDYIAYVERPSAGVSFVFTDEAMLLGKGEQAIGTGALFFTGIFFYAEGVDGYSQYGHELPGGLDFSDRPSSLRRRLGEPEWSRWLDGSVLTDRWQLDGRKLHVSYSDDGQTRVVTYFVPNIEG